MGTSQGQPQLMSNGKTQVSTPLLLEQNMIIMLTLRKGKYQSTDSTKIGKERGSSYQENKIEMF